MTLPVNAQMPPGTVVSVNPTKVEVNKRPWELPLAILLWINVVGFVIFAIFLLTLIGDAGEPSLYEY